MSAEYIELEIYSLPDVLRKNIVGQKIVGIVSDDTLVLSNGATLQIDGFGDCCAFADFDFKDFGKIIASGNVVTNVTEVAGDGDSAQIFILTEAGVGGSVDLNWSEGSGYYSYGYIVTIRKPEIGEGVEQKR